MSKPLLIAWHSRTGASEALAIAAAHGAGDKALLLPSCDVTEEAMIGSLGFLFCCPENLAALSGAMKEMFDRLYYCLLGRIEGRAYATIIAAGSDGSGAQRQIDRIATGWRLRRIAEPMIVNCSAQSPEAILAPKTLPTAEIARAGELGSAMAEGLTTGVF